MSRSSIQNVLSLGDPALSYNFDLFFPTIPGSSETRHITYRCQSTDLPGTQLENVEAGLHGVVIQYAGRRMFTQTMNVTFLETSDWATRETFRRWIATARDWRSNSGSGINTYATRALIVKYDDIPNPVSTTQINLIWPENMQEVSLDGSQGSAVMLQVSFRYTDWETV